ncbi:MAG TPA: acetyl-CoA hydrolase/transferase family protein [Cyclobacteriaceae bacterium]
MKEPKYVSAEEALSHVKSNTRIFIHSVAAAPKILIDALVARKNELHNVELTHLHTETPAPYVDEEYDGHFFLRSLFVGANVRKATQNNRADYIPVFLSETPVLIRQNILPINTALVQISPPDRHGYCSLGVSVDATLAAIEKAELVIAQVNPKMPRAAGDACVSIEHFDFFVEHESELPKLELGEISATEKKIGQNVAAMIDDGATLQMGIGNIPNAVLAALGNHKRLGIHTEMFSDGILPLIEKGALTGEEKKLDREKIVATFVMGSQKLYDFLDDNLGVLMKDVAYVNDVATIRQNPKVTAINSAIEIDLTGQVCADSIGTKHFSGVGGQIDFIRGASYSKGGKPIIALTSTTNRGVSKIVPMLKPGAGVVSTRANVHYIATEFGVANLYGKSLSQRAKELIKIAHPDHREHLATAARERFGKLCE